jgi:hypothetical protein
MGIRQLQPFQTHHWKRDLTAKRVGNATPYRMLKEILNTPHYLPCDTPSVCFWVSQPKLPLETSQKHLDIAKSTEIGVGGYDRIPRKKRQFPPTIKATSSLTSGHDRSQNRPRFAVESATR